MRYHSSKHAKRLEHHRSAHRPPWRVTLSQPHLPTTPLHHYSHWMPNSCLYLLLESASSHYDSFIRVSVERSCKQTNCYVKFAYRLEEQDRRKARPSGPARWLRSPPSAA